MNIHVYTAEQLRPRIIRAIQHGNHEWKYIMEACRADYSLTQLNTAIKQLESDGIIHYVEFLEGYYLS